MLQQWAGDPGVLATTDLSMLDSAAEMQLMQRIIDFPDAIETAARGRASSASSRSCSYCSRRSTVPG